jgi:hypothetical protein
LVCPGFSGDELLDACTTRRFEIAQRRLVPVAEAFDGIWVEDGFGPLYRRVFLEAALPVRR